MSDPTTVIGLGGALRSGKDTAADYLVAEYGYVKLGMSDQLALALYTLNPIILLRTAEEQALVGRGQRLHMRYQEIVDAVGYVKAKELPEVRALLQRLGTDVGRNLIHPNVWADITRRAITEQQRQGHNVVLTGVRYPNELDMLHRLYAATVYIDRQDEHSAAARGHSSETSLKPSDFQQVIHNVGTIEQLHRMIEDVHISQQP